MYLPPVLLVAAVATACALPAQELAGAEKVAAGSNASAPCAPITVDELLRVLGGAYNGRYMAVEQPPSLQSGRPDRSRPNGTAQVGDGAEVELEEDAEGFAVPAGHRALLGHSAAWLPQPDERRGVGVGVGVPTPKATAATAPAAALHPDQQGAPLRRVPRHQPAFNPTPWACEGRVLWADLGADYFPRFLRSVECTERRCWYDRFECRPRAFAVKVLRRVPGKCAPPPPHAERPSRGGGVAPTPAAPTELWLWEERAVAFCCECASVTV